MNSYNLIRMFSYDLLTPQWRLGLWVGLREKKIVHFHMIRIVQIHTKSPLCKIVTFSCEIGFPVKILGYFALITCRLQISEKKTLKKLHLSVYFYYTLSILRFQLQIRVFKSLFLLHSPLQLHYIHQTLQFYSYLYSE